MHTGNDAEWVAYALHKILQFLSRLYFLTQQVTLTQITDRAVAAQDFLLRNASGGVQEMQCACRRNGLFMLFQHANMLSGAQRRRYMNIAEHIGNIDRFLLFRNGA